MGNVEPTEKQKRAFKEIVENGRTKGEAMILAGYSPNTAVAPTKMTHTKGWQELLDEYLPDDLLAQKHLELLEVPIKITVKKKGEIETEIEQLDTFAISKGLDMGYKLKGKYAPEKKEITGDINIQDSRELDIIANEVEQRLKEKKLNDRN